jgi:hypothetical protein
VLLFLPELDAADHADADLRGREPELPAGGGRVSRLEAIRVDAVVDDFHRHRGATFFQHFRHLVGDGDVSIRKVDQPRAEQVAHRPEAGTHFHIRVGHGKVTRRRDARTPCREQGERGVFEIALDRDDEGRGDLPETSGELPNSGGPDEVTERLEFGRMLLEQFDLQMRVFFRRGRRDSRGVFPLAEGARKRTGPGSFERTASRPSRAITSCPPKTGLSS